MPAPDTTIDMWTIYDHPFDYPEHFVVRRWVVSAGQARPDIECVLATTIEEARTFVPPGLYCLGKVVGDDRKVAETWI